MSTIIRLLLEDFTTICLAIGLGIITMTNRNLDERTNRSFVLFIALVLVLIVADMTDYYLSGLSTPSVLRYLASAAGYTLRPAGVVIFISILFRRRKSGVIIWIPLLLLCVIAFTSCFTHLMFWLDETNRFIRGPLSYLSHVLSGVYLAVLIVLTFKMHRYITSGEIFTVLYIAVICVAATVLESLLSDYRFLITGAMMTSCALYYVVLYIETYKRDPLTCLMNRRSFYLDANRMRNRSVAVVSLDLNGLKDINDSRGHGAGDKALQSIGNAMLDKSAKKFSAYRVGGDEFMALGKDQSDEAAKAYIEYLRAALKADGLTASFGLARYNAGDDFDAVCNQADVRMYDDKKQYKHRTSQRG